MLQTCGGNAAHLLLANGFLLLCGSLVHLFSQRLLQAVLSETSGELDHQEQKQSNLVAGSRFQLLLVTGLT